MGKVATVNLFSIQLKGLESFIQQTKLNILNFFTLKALTFTRSKSVFGSHFTISFWFRATMDTLSPMIPVFSRKDAYL